MPRTLFLLRHAKSDWTDPTLADHERPLSPRGRRAAKSLARYVTSAALHPALVLCSSARRAQDTLGPMRVALGPDTEVHVEDLLYGADAGDLLGRLRAVDAGVESVLVIGHNPALEDLTRHLVASGDSDAVEQLDAKFPTGALAVLDIGGTPWAELGGGVAHLRDLILPRSLPGGG